MPLPGYAFDCLDVLREHPDSKSGLYRIYPSGQSVFAFCDMETDGGGWTVRHQDFSTIVFFFKCNLTSYSGLKCE